MKNIWIVEDDPYYQSLLSQFLKTTGYTISCFSSGEECLQQAESRPFAVIVDYDLGRDMNGIDLLRKLKESTPELPVISISAAKNLGVVRDFLKSGSEDFIEKNSATLLRIKLQLDRITENMNRQKRKTRVKLIWIAVLSFLIATAATAAFVLL